LLGTPVKAAEVTAALPLQVSELAKRSPPIEVAEELLRAAVDPKPEPLRTLRFSPVLPLDGGDRVVAYSACDHRSCRGKVSRLHPGPSLRVQAQAPLPTPSRVFAVGGLIVQGLALVDVTGDGQPELLVDYQVSEPPRPALGSISHQYYAIYNLPQLTLAWHFELHRSGGAVEPVCDFAVDMPPLLPSQPATLLTHGSCQPGVPSNGSPPAKATAPTLTRFVFTNKTRQFLRQ
jgi:hypothetical protein